jgi:hypothetical protein
MRQASVTNPKAETMTELQELQEDCHTPRSDQIYLPKYGRLNHALNKAWIWC